MPKKVIFPELEAGLAGKGIMKKEVCQLLDIMPRTLSNKLTGVSHFTVEEAVQIQEQFFKDMTVNELFKKESEELS
ncbi:MAG: hypothetical protein IJ642_12050 [Oscillospiraceae bacterium]|nr:hypothetical protein [Oscillospiraceae bacterium]